jgi:uncharacterized damage-inducible protein DinB
MTRTAAVAAAAALLFAARASAQQPTPLAQALATEMKGNETNMVGAAEAMPPDKYGFKPTPPQVSFGDLVYHAAIANYTLCGIIAGEKAPEAAVKADGAKAALIDQMKASFAYCDKALPKIDPATLGEEISLYNRKVTRAWVLFHLALDWGDHYSQAAMMLRLNGITPPSSQRRATK